MIAELTPIRKLFKVANYSCIYGVGGASLARGLKSTIAAAKKLIKAYWARNWAVKKIAEDCKVKTVEGQMWLYNPVSQLWMSLRYDKDRFSTLNQSTGVYCFDRWIYHILSKRPQLTGQFHDEIILQIKEGNREKCSRLLKWAIQKVNEELKLNVQLDIDTQFGKNYSEIH